MAAKLAVNLFIKEIGSFVADDLNGSRRTLHSLRNIFFTGKPVRLTREIDQLLLTYHDGLQPEAWNLLMQLQEQQSMSPLSVANPWWGGMRSVVCYQSQLPDNLRGSLKSVKLAPPHFLAKDLVRGVNIRDGGRVGIII